MSRLCAVLVALLVGSVACSTGPTTLGSNALGPALSTPDQVAEWVEEKTGECEEATDRTIEEFAEFVGPLRAKLYAPYVDRWATCKVAPYERLGLVVFRREALADLQRAWQEALKTGQVGDNPDFGFGNGFALSGTIGLESLGLHRLHCTPPPAEGQTLPAEVQGCYYMKVEGHHH